MLKLLIRKRNGELDEFKMNKIASAVKRSMAETEKGVDNELAETIAEEIETSFFKEEAAPTVESIQDRVEELLASLGRFDASKRYILYREERSRLREQGWQMTDLQRDIYEQKYRHDGESFKEFLERIGKNNRSIQKLIRDKKFMPAGRILAGRGLDDHGRKVTLSNCYVMPKVEDTLESIFDTAKWLARTYSYGGGVGVNMSKLRPSGAKVNNAAHTTTGAVSFMELYSLVTGLIGMRGRRGALMLNMDISHPDIIDFLNLKTDLTKVTKANISINVTNEFMEAVRNKAPYQLRFKVEATGEEISRWIDASELFTLLAKNNHDFAEPGVLFQDRIDSWHLMSEDETFEFAGVNPCAEETLPAFGSCNLSSINLSEFVKFPFTEEAYIDVEGFVEAVHHGIIYLNEILDENMELHPLPQQTEVSRDLRQIGLSVMGVADMFIKMGVKYGSTRSIELIHEVGHIFINEALRQSALLAKEQGTFLKYDRKAVLKSPFLLSNATEEVYELIEQYGLRNSQLLTIPPSGSISTLIGCSNGLEPLFQLSYTRKTESLYNADTYYKVFTPIAKEYMELHNLTSEDQLPDYFITTSNLSHRDRVNVQSAWQQYIDASISSTVNLPEETTVEEIEDLYFYAWEQGLKGITVFRDNCKRVGILTKEEPKEKREEQSVLIQDPNEITECST